MRARLGAVIAFLAVFGEVQAERFDFLGRAQADDRLDDEGDDDRADDGQHQGERRWP